MKNIPDINIELNAFLNFFAFKFSFWKNNIKMTYIMLFNKNDSHIEHVLKTFKK